MKHPLGNRKYYSPSASGRLLHISSTEGLNIGSYGEFDDIYESFGHKFQNLANFESLDHTFSDYWDFLGGRGKFFQNRVWYRLIQFFALEIEWRCPFFQIIYIDRVMSDRNLTFS